MEKYSVVFECEYKGIRAALATAEEIAEKSAVIAPIVYMLLCCYADKMMLTYDTADYGTNMIDYGISILQELGYIEIGGKCKNDDYKRIWIKR